MLSSRLNKIIFISSFMALLITLSIVLFTLRVHAENNKIYIKEVQARYYIDINRLIFRGITNLPQGTEVRIKFKDEVSGKRIEKTTFVQDGTIFLMIKGIDDGNFKIIASSKNINVVLGGIALPKFN